jgi:uncharacterized protein (TIGR04255 family)
MTSPDASAVGTTGRHFTLERPAIEVAVAELRFNSAAPEVDRNAALSLRDALRGSGHSFSVINEAVRQEVTVSVNPAGGQSVQGEVARGWEMVDEPTQVHLSILPGTVVVQTSRYARWSETFEPLLAPVLRWVEAAHDNGLRIRVGLRYVNRLTDSEADSPSRWADHLDSSLLGPVAGGYLASRVTQAHQQLELSNEDGTKSVLRHGVFVDAAARHRYSYLFDLDVFDDRAEPLEAASTLAVFTALNRAAAETFRQALTDAYSAELGLVYDKDESAGGHR